MENNNPLSPHIQIYSWHISSLISIVHRITGVINIIAITLICLWIVSLLLGIIFGPDTPFVGDVYNNVSNILNMLGEDGLLVLVSVIIILSYLKKD